jgi:hypothetical protein
MIRQRRRQLALILILATISFGYGPCSGKQQPLTVADVLTRLGNVKRDLRARNEITAQQDYDISAKLLEANLAYKRFIDDELARLAASGGTAPDPSARRAAISALVTSLKGLQDPTMLGIKSANGQKLWRESITTLNTVIAGLDALQGGE